MKRERKRKKDRNEWRSNAEAKGMSTVKAKCKAVAKESSRVEAKGDYVSM